MEKSLAYENTIGLAKKAWYKGQYVLAFHTKIKSTYNSASNRTFPWNVFGMTKEPNFSMYLILTNVNLISHNSLAITSEDSLELDHEFNLQATGFVQLCMSINYKVYSGNTKRLVVVIGWKWYTIDKWKYMHKTLQIIRGGKFLIFISNSSLGIVTLWVSLFLCYGSVSPFAAAVAIPNPWLMTDPLL